ncbi:hypothetical protein GTC6_13691 [Gordonia terrae C-6]|uniref:Uncharacterized protein n=1 Tax=Gordonia terrae C-6 TaxID=1316928 RepID=R7Y8A2_9ACTN|nr:hypothetical protein [Gordonia terrae]EON32220.1 hypothetical protein GTC6_13691 [Gordonia terrae C-6]
MPSTPPVTAVTENDGVSEPPAILPYEPPESWIPADQRWFGLDRRTVVPGLVVLLIAVVLAFVPAIVDERVTYDDPVLAGDVIELDKGVAFSPVPGWEITDGLRRGDPMADGGYPPTASVSDAGVTFQLKAADFSGTPGALLDQIRDTQEAYGIESPVVENETVAITTRDGHRGLMSRYEGADVDGVIAAFVGNGVGVQAIAVSPTTREKQSAGDVARMIESITIDGGSR